MDERIKVNLVGNPTEDLKLVENSLRDNSAYKLRVYNYISDLVNDDKRFLNPRAITIINLEDNWKEVLESAREYNSLTDGRLVVIGPENTQAMRSAMRLNVHDYFSRPLDLKDFHSSIKELGDKLAKIETEESSSLVTSIINAAGGAGGSFIATNLAHLLAVEHKQHVALLDMDVQFGSQALNLDLTLQYGISDVLASVEKLDTIALPAYLAKHKSGVHVLGEKLEDIVIPGEIPPENIEKFIDLCTTTFSHTVIDLPRQIDSLFAAVVAKSHRIVLVMHQSLAHVRDTKRLLSILLQEFEIPKEHVTVLVNRFDEKHAISIADIESTLSHPAPIRLPNDYQNAMKATELAKPLVESAPNSILAKGLADLTHKVIGNNFTTNDEKTLIKRAFGGLFSKKK